MNDERRNIWKEPWKGPRKIFLWFALLTIASFVVVFCIELLSDAATGTPQLATLALVVAARIGLTVVLGVMFIRWLCCWRNFRRFLFGLVCLVTLVALFYAEENWRGGRAWNKYRRALEAQGAQLDYRAFIPKPVPDEQNFAATPLVKSWFLKDFGTVKFDSDDYGQSVSRVSDSKDRDKGRRQFVDLVAWKSAFTAFRSGETNRHPMFFTTNRLDSETRAKAAPTVLEGLKTSDAVLEELRASSKRPNSQYPVNYDLNNPWGILIPHLAKIKGVAQRLHLKACAELAAGQNENALGDVKLALYLADSLKEEPFLISYLVRIACVQIAIQPVWEGLAGHRWSDAQLQELQSFFQRYNFFADMKRPLDAERAAGVLTADLLHQKRYRLSELANLSDPSDPTGGDLENLIARLAPRGWYRLEQLNYCRLYESQLKGTFDPAKKTVSPREIESRAHELEREVAGGRLGKGFNAILHHQVIATMLLPVLGKVPFRAAAVQTAADQAALACALERYHLANGQFPEKLDALAPRFLDKIPNDVISGGTMKYRRTEDGGFILYCVGWNEKDDGGKSGKTLFDEKEGDWVWSSSPAGDK